MNKNRGKRLPPKVSGNYGEILAEELMAFWSFLVSNWMYILPGLILAAVLIYFVRPLPPKTVESVFSISSHDPAWGSPSRKSK